MRVLAADAYILCCGLLRMLMVHYGDLRVTPANSIDEVLKRVPELLPDLDLVLLDASMPGMIDFAGLRRTVAAVSDVPVIVTSPSESRDEIIAAIRSGARGYIAMSSKPQVLQHALALVMSGEFYIPAAALRDEPCRTADTLLISNDVAPPEIACAENLSPRQREVLLMLADGKSNKEIARQLDLLEGTIKIHVKAILRKLRVRNRTEAVLAAARAGYLPREILSH